MRFVLHKGQRVALGLRGIRKQRDRRGREPWTPRHRWMWRGCKSSIVRAHGPLLRKYVFSWQLSVWWRQAPASGRALGQTKQVVQP
jgi:hypothetical protein